MSYTYTMNVLERAKNKNPNEPEFHQAMTEIYHDKTVAKSRSHGKRRSTGE